MKWLAGTAVVAGAKEGAGTVWDWLREQDFPDWIMTAREFDQPVLQAIVLEAVVLLVETSQNALSEADVEVRLAELDARLEPFRAQRAASSVGGARPSS